MPTAKTLLTEQFDQDEEYHVRQNEFEKYATGRNQDETSWKIADIIYKMIRPISDTFDFNKQNTEKSVTEMNTDMTEDNRQRVSQNNSNLVPNFDVHSQDIDEINKEKDNIQKDNNKEIMKVTNQRKNLKKTPKATHENSSDIYQTDSQLKDASFLSKSRGAGYRYNYQNNNWNHRDSVPRKRGRLSTPKFKFPRFRDVLRAKLTTDNNYKGSQRSFGGSASLNIPDFLKFVVTMKPSSISNREHYVLGDYAKVNRMDSGNYFPER